MQFIKQRNTDEDYPKILIVKHILKKSSMTRSGTTHNIYAGNKNKRTGNGAGLA